MVEEVAGDQGLALAGGGEHPQAQALYLDVVQHLGEPLGGSGVASLLGVDVGANVRQHLEGLAEEGLDALD